MFEDEVGAEVAMFAKKYLFDIIILIFITIIGRTISESNVTVNNNVTENYNVTESAVIPNPSFWCPKNTDNMYAANMWFVICRSYPCLQTDVRLPNITKNGTSVEYIDDVREVCPASRKFNRKMVSPLCHRVRLPGQNFTLNHTDGSLYEMETGITYNIGEYFYYEITDEALICREHLLENDLTDNVPFRCQPYKPTPTDEIQFFSNGSIFLPKFNRVVGKGYYHLQENSTKPVVDAVCFAINKKMDDCKITIPIPGENLRLLPNLDLDTNLAVEQTYELGDYLLDEDHSLAVVCVETANEVRDETRYLYGAAYVVSVIFSFLTLIIHMFYPNINYHTKALLCHIFSLFVMYVVLAVRSFVWSFPTDASRFTIFCILYVSALSAFFWLNVLAYELWKVFNNLQGTPGNLVSQRIKRRWFIAKCFYAWGIPVLMCCLAVGMSYEPSIANFLDLSLNHEGVNWFDTKTSILLLFYGPIVVILAANVFFFVHTIYNIKKASRGTQILNKKVSRKLFRVFVKLFIVMGIVWFAEVISWSLKHKADEAVWYVTDVFNASQGVAIFLVYVCKRSTFKMIKKKLNGEKYSTGTNGTKTTSSSSNSKSRKISNSVTMTTFANNQ